MIKHSLNIRKYTVLAGLYVGLIVFLMAVNPKDAPIALLLVPLVWLFICLFLTWSYIFDKFQQYKLIRKRKKTLAILLALLPVLMILLKSIDQLGMRDSLLIVIFVICAVFYATRVRFNNKGP